MPDFDAYFGDDEAIDARSRAVDAWNRIKRDASSVVLVRGTTTMAAQTVRVEFSGTGEEVDATTGRAGRQRVVIFGVIDHPSIADTNIQARDRFAINKKQYEVITVVDLPGEVQAFCEAIA
jgi:hypothetical protein